MSQAPPPLATLSVLGTFNCPAQHGSWNPARIRPLPSVGGVWALLDNSKITNVLYFMAPCICTVSEQHFTVFSKLSNILQFSTLHCTARASSSKSWYTTWSDIWDVVNGKMYYMVWYLRCSKWSAVLPTIQWVHCSHPNTRGGPGTSHSIQAPLKRDQLPVLARYSTHPPAFPPTHH